jgi:hypothetical protein
MTSGFVTLFDCNDSAGAYHDTMYNFKEIFRAVVLVSGCEHVQ